MKYLSKDLRTECDKGKYIWLPSKQMLAVLNDLDRYKAALESMAALEHIPEDNHVCKASEFAAKVLKGEP